MVNVSSDWNVLWVQPDGPGTACELLTCYAIDTISNPKGTHTAQRCFNPITGAYDMIGMTQDPADLPNLTLDGLTPAAADYLEKTLRKGCPLTFYVNSMECNPKNAFLGWVRGKSFQGALMETDDEGSVMLRDSPEMMTQSFDCVGTRVSKYFAAEEYRRTLAHTAGALDIVFLGGPTCLTDCGPDVETCAIGYITQVALPAAAARVLYTTNGGETWAITFTDPFPVDEDIGAIVAVPISGNTWRLIVANATTAVALPARVAYADVDIIATPSLTIWTTAQIGANTDFFPFNGSLFALDQYHIWGGTDTGEIYFSPDAGVAWTAQGAGLADMVRSIKFIDTKVGVAVGGTTGASHVLAYTYDGGLTWNPVVFTGPGATVMANAVWVFSKRKWLVGFENGTLYMTWDQGANWTLLPQPAVAGLTAYGDVNDIEAVDECTIWVAGEATVSGNAVGLIRRSVNGGYNWEAWTTATAAGGLGMQSIHACNENKAIAAGDTA